MGSRVRGGKVCWEKRCEDEGLVGDTGRDVKTSKNDDAACGKLRTRQIVECL